MNLLIIDSNYICYKAMMTLMGLSHEDHHTGVIFGFLRQIQQIAEDFEEYHFAFTWDSRKSFRRDIYPEYKRKTQPLNEEMEQIVSVGKPQFTEIRQKILPRLGFKNNFIQTGLEADDLIAHIVQDYQREMEEIIIVSSDEDLYQLLQDKVRMYNNKSKFLYSKDNFTVEKTIDPRQWPLVKAIAGCTSDNVKGINGIGEKTVIKWIKGELSQGKKKGEIETFDPSFNLSLVQLPHIKTQAINLIEDELDFSVFEGLCLDMGFASLLKKDNYNSWRKILNESDKKKKS